VWERKNEKQLPQLTTHKENRFRGLNGWDQDIVGAKLESLDGEVWD